MKKGDIVSGVIGNTTFPAKGHIYVDGEKVSVKGVLPGQKIEARIVRTRKDRAEAVLLRVIEKSSEETQQPPCPHFGLCGGCTLQTLSYEAQLRLKERHVRELLEPVICAKDAVWEPIVASPEIWGYRNKMEFSFGDEYRDGPLALGLHKKGSFYDIVTTSECQIVDADFRAILTATLLYAKEAGLSYYHKMRHEGYLRHLLVRKAKKTGEILVALVTTGSETPDLSAWVQSLRGLCLQGTLVGVLHTQNNAVGDVIRNDHTTVLYGKDFFTEHLLGLSFTISPFSFFQTNSSGAEALYSVVREMVGDKKDRIVFDLYSGTGTIAQLLALVAGQVVGVELVPEAVEAAKENAVLNGLQNCRFLAGDVLKVLDEISERPDFIVLDPPRDGIHPKALKKILDYGVEKMIYISCKPTSLARDLQVMQEQGYCVERIRCVDMFAWNCNVETVILLSKLNTKQHIEVELNLDELDLTSAESKATYEEIKAYVLEHTGLKVSHLYIAQVKQKYGIIERENYNKPKSESSKQPKCPPEKEAAITEALKFFRMI